ncbi:MAG TPA: hypothetical protein PKA41_14790 [Verrucomicrobiota bacterium]|nr:hypothetical protein [Verrucomicrobiota bacterium]
MTSPNGKYEVMTHDYGEVRMGSPEFGSIKIHGTSLDTTGEFGVVMAFSPDSRFLATEQLVGTIPGPHTRVVVFDFERRRRIIVHDQNPGFIRRFKWSPDGLLSFVTWSHLAGEGEHSWQSPPPQSRSFLERIFG